MQWRNKDLLMYHQLLSNARIFGLRCAGQGYFALRQQTNEKGRRKPALIDYRCETEDCRVAHLFELVKETVARE
jgi:hypothetical protein